MSTYWVKGVAPPAQCFKDICRRWLAVGSFRNVGVIEIRTGEMC